MIATCLDINKNLLNEFRQHDYSYLNENIQMLTVFSQAAVEIMEKNKKM